MNISKEKYENADDWDMQSQCPMCVRVSTRRILTTSPGHFIWSYCNASSQPTSSHQHEYTPKYHHYTQNPSKRNNLVWQNIAQWAYLHSLISLCKVLHYFWTRRRSSNPIRLELDTDWQKLPIHYQYQWIDEDWQITQFVPILSQSLTK